MEASDSDVPEKTCLATVVITSENNVNIVSQHNHLPESDKIEAEKTLIKTKSRATTTMEKPRQVVMQSCPQSVSASSLLLVNHFQIMLASRCYTFILVGELHSWLTLIMANFNLGELYFGELYQGQLYLEPLKDRKTSISY